MIIENIDIISFGKLKNVNISPSQHLNVIFAPNESGKTTLLSFIKFIFYGTKIKKQKSELSFKDKYMPWSGDLMCGSITFVADGKKYIIYRCDGGNLSTKKLEVRDAVSGEEIKLTTEPGKYFFSIGEKAFSDSCFITDTIGDSTIDSDLVAMLSQGNTESASYKKVKDILDNKIADLTSSKRSASEYNLMKAEKSKLEEEMLNVDSSLSDIAEQTNEANENILRLSVEIENINKAIYDKEKNEVVEEFIILSDEYSSENERLLKLERQKLQMDKEQSLKKNETNYSESLQASMFGNGRFLWGIAFFMTLLSIALTLVLLNQGHLSLLYILVPVLVALIVYVAVSIHKIIKKEKKCLMQTKNPNNDDNGEANESTNDAVDVLLSVIEDQIASSRLRIKKINDDLNSIKNNNPDIDFTSKININDTNPFTKYEINDIMLKKDECTILLESEKAHLKSLHDRMDKLKENRTQCNVKLNELHLKECNIKEKVVVLNSAVEILDNAFSNLRDMFSPKLSRNAFKIIKSVTGDSFDDLLSDENMNATVKIGAVFKDEKYMSKGTRDLIYIALRLSLCEFLTKSETVPVYFDDVLAFFDDSRCENMLLNIHKLSADRQIFLCTCRSRESKFFFDKNDVMVIGL